MEAKKAFSERLLEWFREYGRSYAWRKTEDPYEIIIAEIMLQRTKADQVEPVYIDFMKKFQNVRKLNKATEKEVSEFFSRLGLLWRVKLVKRLANELINRYKGEIPKERDALLLLPAVGEYIADAILCFAYKKDVAVVDSNVCRIIGRLYNKKAKGEARRDPQFREAINQLLPPGKAREFNWAMIDFGALICKPKPQCSKCPLNLYCCYYLNNEQLQSCR